MAETRPYIIKSRVPEKLRGHQLIWSISVLESPLGDPNIPHKFYLIHAKNELLAIFTMGVH